MSFKLQKIRAYLLLLFPAILLAVVSPVGVGIAHAWTLGSLFGNLTDAVANILVQVVRFLIYESSSLILRSAAFIFDSVVPYSLGVGTPNAFQSAFITEGWGLMRDITNMVFIFAMLYIAIATILQVGAGRNTKALIINIILIALFVNFSLFLAQVVIDAANLLALEFYNALTSASAHGIAAVFIVGFNPQSLLGTTGFNAWISGGSNLSVLFFVYLFGGIVQLIAAYMILLASFLFIGRIVVLWILMIVSPLAFAAYIIPKFSGQFNKWWDYLLKQAFVAPIFLFFFYIFALFVQPEGGLSVFIHQASQAASAGDALFDVILKIALGFSLVVAFLMISLKMTKSLSGEVAGFATKAVGFTVGAAAAAMTGPAGAARLAKLAGTFGVPTAGMGAGAAVGRVAGAPLAPIRGAAISATEDVAKKAASKAREKVRGAAERVVGAGTKQGLGGALLRGFGVARGAAKIEAAARAGVKTDIDKAEKDLDGLSNEALQTEYGYATTTAEKRAAIIKVLGKRKKLKPQEEGKGPMTHDSIIETLKTVKDRGYETDKEIEDKYLWQYAETQEEKEKTSKTLTPDALKEIGKAKREVTKPDGTKEELPSDFFDTTQNPDGTENTEVFDIAVKNMTSAHFKMLLDPEVRSDFSENFVKNLKDAMARQKKKVADELRIKGDEAGAKEREASKYTIEDYFKEIQSVRGASAIKEPSVRQYFESNDISYRKKTKDEDDEEGGGTKEKKEKTDEEEKKEREKFYQDFFGAGENKT